MRPILFEIPAIPAPGWMALLAVFFGLSAYWTMRDASGEELSPEERRRRNLSTIVYNALFFAIGAALLWQFRERVAHPLPVRAYGFLLMLAFGAGLICLQRVARGTLLPPEGAIDLILGLLLVGVVSARLLYILLQWHTYGGNWREWFQVWEGGLSFHGGLAGGIAWVAWFAWRRGLRFWWLADLMGPSLALGYAVARIGCFLNGCCYGTPTHLPWGVRFADPPLSQHLTPPSHPVQFYASLANLAIFGILLRSLKHKRYDGQIVGLYLVLYSVYRFLAEALRKGVTGEVFALGLTEAQWASLAIAGLGITLMLSRWRAPAGTPDGAVDTSRRARVPSATGWVVLGTALLAVGVAGWIHWQPQMNQINSLLGQVLTDAGNTSSREVMQVRAFYMASIITACVGFAILLASAVVSLTLRLAGPPPRPSDTTGAAGPGTRSDAPGSGQRNTGDGGGSRVGGSPHKVKRRKQR